VIAIADIPRSRLQVSAFHRTSVRFLFRHFPIVGLNFSLVDQQIHYMRRLSHSTEDSRLQDSRQDCQHLRIMLAFLQMGRRRYPLTLGVVMHSSRIDYCVGRRTEDWMMTIEDGIFERLLR
jgi:hypothetical protein